MGSKNPQQQQAQIEMQKQLWEAQQKQAVVSQSYNTPICPVQDTVKFVIPQPSEVKQL